MNRRRAGFGRTNGVKGFTAEVLAENMEMLRIFHKIGLQVQSHLNGDVYTVRIPIERRGDRTVYESEEA